MLNNKSILVTGGTGSFGNKFITMTLEKYNPKQIVVYSRDEMKQWDMAERYKNDSRIVFIIGDIRDKEQLIRSLNGIDYVVHAAATKIVPTAEYNPFECIKTNINGAMNLIDACIEKNINKVVALSTDKASNPINLYGATKLASDKLFIASNPFAVIHNTMFSIVRYGNVIGSRGSVVPFFVSLLDKKEFPITDPDMTRFMLTLEQAVELVWHAFNDMRGGEIYVKKSPSMNILDIAKSVSQNAGFNIIGIRPGEKIHEQMISVEDSPHTFEYEDYYKILPAIYNLSEDRSRIGNGKKVASNFVYSSDDNKEQMSVDELSAWIDSNIYRGKLD
jgi:UDP-N-acetylglucosamine 4,6-dehydratase (inverting)